MFDETKEEHESYGLLQISRCQCTPATNVFGSSVKTGNPIRLRISRAVRYRGLNEHTYHDKQQLIEIEMSPSQFADAITSLNCGVGTPVTLLRVNCERMADCPDIDQRQLFHEEFNQDVADASKQLTELLKEAKEILGSKGAVKAADKKGLLNKIGSVEQNIRANMPFVHQQFNRAMDKTTSEAKAEVEAFIENKVRSIGLDNMQDEILKIEDIK
jgi:hypothetical protein